MAVSDSVSAAVGFTQRQVDRVVPPKHRQQAWDRTTNFASARPLLFSFILAQLTLSFLPLLLFASFVLSVLAFAAGCAIVFTLFWAGVALLFLIPTVLATGGLAILFWAWAVSSFLVAKWTWTMVPENWKGAVGLEGDIFGSQRAKVDHKVHNYVGRADPAQNGNSTVNQAHYEAAYGGQGVKEKLGLDGGVSLADIKAEVNEPAVAM